MLDNPLLHPIPLSPFPPIFPNFPPFPPIFPIFPIFPFFFGNVVGYFIASRVGDFWALYICIAPNLSSPLHRGLQSARPVRKHCTCKIVWLHVEDSF